MEIIDEIRSELFAENYRFTKLHYKLGLIDE